LKLNKSNDQCKNKTPIPYLLEITPSSTPDPIEGTTNFNADNDGMSVTVPFCNSRTNSDDYIEIMNLIPFQGRDTRVGELGSVGPVNCNQFRITGIDGQKNVSISIPFVSPEDY